MCEPLSPIQKDWLMVRKAYEAGEADGHSRGYSSGYSDGLRDGLSQGPTHPAVQLSVERMFGDWQGAEAARQQSTQRFWNEYHRERDAA